MDNYEQHVYMNLMSSIRLDIDYMFQLFESYKYFTVDEIKEVICNVAGFVASERKMYNENA